MRIANQSPLTYDALLTFQRTHKRATLLIVFTVLTGFLVALTGLRLFLVSAGYMESPSETLLCLTVLYVLLDAFLIINRTWLLKRACRKQAARNEVSTYVFTEAGMEIDAVSTEQTVHGTLRYDGILKVTESPDAFYLYVRPNAAHVVSKQGFTEGTEADFRALLHMVIKPKKLKIR